MLPRSRRALFGRDFYKPAHGHIFGAIRALIERGEPLTR